MANQSNRRVESATRSLLAHNFPTAFSSPTPCINAVAIPKFDHYLSFFLLLKRYDNTCCCCTEWVMWEHKANQGSKDPDKWKENMKQLYESSTVEDFWRYFQHVPKPSEVFFDGDCRKMVGPEAKTIEEYSLFKKGIEPEWGDPQNLTGGEWFCRQFLELEVLDLYWQNLVMSCVGETIDDDVAGDDDAEDGSSLLSYVNGARVVDKSRHYPLYKLELWINTRDPVIKERIKNKLIEIITDGQPVTKRLQPKFDWRDHSN